MRHLGSAIRYPTPARGVARFPASAVKEAGLHALPQPIACFQEHAILRGWGQPSSSSDDKARRKAMAAVLVREASILVFD